MKFKGTDTKWENTCKDSTAGRIEDGNGHIIAVVLDAKDEGEGIIPASQANIAMIENSLEMAKESARLLPILKKLQEDHPNVWAEITEGTGVATTNRFEHLLKKSFNC